MKTGVYINKALLLLLLHPDAWWQVVRTSSSSPSLPLELPPFADSLSNSSEVVHCRSDVETEDGVAVRIVREGVVVDDICVAGVLARQASERKWRDEQRWEV